MPGKMPAQYRHAYAEPGKHSETAVVVETTAEVGRIRDVDGHHARTVRRQHDGRSPNDTTSHTGTLTLGENCDNITGASAAKRRISEPACPAATSNRVPDSRIVDGAGMVTLAICLGDAGFETSKTTNRPSPVPAKRVLPDSANALTGIATLPISTGACGFDASTTFRLSASPKKTLVPET